MAQSVEYPDLPFVAPRSFTKGRKPGCPKVIVIHYTAGHEGPDAGENGAAYDGRRTDGVSTHYHVDSNSVVQCVLTTDEAHTARNHGNDLGIQYELAGTVQTRAQWLDPVSDATLTNAARQAARDAAKYHIPVRRLTVAELRAAHPDFGNRPTRGFVGHVDATYAFPEDHGTHTDPGPQFPWDVFLARVSQFMSGETSMADNVNDLADVTTALADGTTKSGYVSGDAAPHVLPNTLSVIRVAAEEAKSAALAARAAAEAPRPVTLSPGDIAALAAAVAPALAALIPTVPSLQEIEDAAFRGAQRAEGQ